MENTTETPLEAVTGLDYGKVGTTLNKSILFVGVYIHRWRGQFLIHEALVKLGKTELAQDLVTNPRWNLMPEVWKKKFNGVESQIKNIIAQGSIGTEGFNFPLKGVHIIARQNFGDFVKRLREVEVTCLKPLVQEFTKRWPETISRLRDEVNELEVWKEISKHLPQDGNTLRKKFWIETVVVPIKLDTGDFEKWSEVDAKEAISEVRERCQQFTAQVAGTVVRGLQKELKDAVDNLVNRIDAKGVVKEATLDAVRNAFDKLQQFNFVMTPELQDKMDEAKGLLNSNDCKDFNKDLKTDAKQMSSQLAVFLKAVRSQVDSDLTVKHTFGAGRRSIRT